MIAVLFVLLLALPIVELWVIVESAQAIGLIPTLVLLVGISLAGAWLLKQQGAATWRRLQDSLRRGRVPTNEATDGALILLGGALLLTPGFVTDAVGLFLLIPPTRAAVKGLARKLLARSGSKRLARSGYYETTATKVPPEDVNRRSIPASPAPPRRPGDDSPDRR